MLGENFRWYACVLIQLWLCDVCTKLYYCRTCMADFRCDGGMRTKRAANNTQRLILNRIKGTFLRSAPWLLIFCVLLSLKVKFRSKSLLLPNILITVKKVYCGTSYHFLKHCDVVCLLLCSRHLRTISPFYQKKKYPSNFEISKGVSDIGVIIVKSCDIWTLRKFSISYR